MSLTEKDLALIAKVVTDTVDARIASVTSTTSTTPARPKESKAVTERNVFNVREALPDKIELDDPISSGGHYQKLLYTDDKDGFHFTVHIFSSKGRNRK